MSKRYWIIGAVVMIALIALYSQRARIRNLLGPDYMIPKDKKQRDMMRELLRIYD